MKRIQVILLMIVAIGMITACGKSIPFKSQEDREEFTLEEMMQVEKEIRNLDGVASFTIQYAEGGVHAELYVKSKKEAKALAKEAFTRMWIETIGIVDLFVKLEGDDDHILIEAFKPANSDKDNKWFIML